MTAMISSSMTCRIFSLSLSHAPERICSSARSNAASAALISSSCSPIELSISLNLFFSSSIAHDNSLLLIVGFESGWRRRRETRGVALPDEAVTNDHCQSMRVQDGQHARNCEGRGRKETSNRLEKKPIRCEFRCHHRVYYVPFGPLACQSWHQTSSAFLHREWNSFSERQNFECALRLLSAVCSERGVHVPHHRRCWRRRAAQRSACRSPRA
jgi:hypothetical protein